MLLEKLVTKLKIEDNEIIKYLDLIGNNNKFSLKLFNKLERKVAESILSILIEEDFIEKNLTYHCFLNSDVVYLADSETQQCELCNGIINTNQHNINKIYINKSKNILLEIEKYKKSSVLNIIDERYFANVSKLKESITNKKIIPFLGAGVSIPLGLPNWQGIIKICEDGLEGRDKEEFIKRLGSGDIFNAIEILLTKSITYNDSIVRKKIQDYIKKNLNIHVDESKHNVKDILKIKPDFFITTNYDDALSKMNDNDTYPLVIDDVDDVQSFLDTKEGQVLHIHGLYHRMKTMIISKKNYDSLYSEDKMKFLMANLISYKFLFIGFSFEDQYFKDLFSEIKGYLGGEHYIILFDAYDRDVQELKDLYNLQVISIKAESVTGLNRIQSLKRLLDYLNE